MGFATPETVKSMEEMSKNDYKVEITKELSVLVYENDDLISEVKHDLNDFRRDCWFKLSVPPNGFLLSYCTYDNGDDLLVALTHVSNMEIGEDVLAYASIADTYEIKAANNALREVAIETKNGHYGVFNGDKFKFGEGNFKTIYVPTGMIFAMPGERGDLEFLSIGDYGKTRNVKAEFLGLKEDINGVDDGDLMPLEEKWVVAISTQHGCSMGCKFCDVPFVGKGLNITLGDLTKQLTTALSFNSKVKFTKRLNLHYARMGEPTFNRNVLEHAKGLHEEVKPFLGDSHIHPVISTMLPKRNKKLLEFLMIWTKEIKNEMFKGSAGLQFSINSTSDSQREDMFDGSSLSLEEISEIGKRLPEPLGRKYALNFALADDYEVDADKLASLFNPNKFMVKITPLHKTQSCDNNDIHTTGGYAEFTPYATAEADLKNVGFDVLIFIPSLEEDESLITCGNAVLSGFKKG